LRTSRFLLAISLLGVPAASQDGDWQEALRQGGALLAANRQEEARTFLSTTLDQAIAKHAPPPALAALETLLASAEYGTGAYDAAEAHLRSAIARRGPANHLDRGIASLQLAAVQTAKQALPDAEFTLCSSLDDVRDAPASYLECCVRLAVIAYRRHAYGLAVKLINKGLEIGNGLPRAAARVLGSAYSLLAWMALQVGETGQACECLGAAKKVLASVPQSPEALAVARVEVDLLRRRGQLADAAKLARDTLERYASVFGEHAHGIIAVSLSLAEVAIDGGDRERAEQILASISGDLADGDLWAQLSLGQAWVALSKRQHAVAQRLAQRVLEAGDKRPGADLHTARALHLLAAVAASEGSCAQAADYAAQAAYVSIERFGVQSPETIRCVEQFTSLRAKAVAAGVDEAALPTPLRGLRLGENLEAGAGATDAEVEALVESARERLAAGQWEAALADLEGAKRERRGEPLVYYYEVLAHRRGGHLGDALAAANEGIRFGPTEARLYAVRAAMNLDLARYEAAAVDATYAMILGAEVTRCLMVRGCAYGGRGQHQRAETDFAEWKRVAPADHDAWVFHAKALIELGQRDRAEAELRATIEAKDREVDARLALVHLYRRSGERERGIAECSHLIDAHKDDHGIATWQRAVLYYEGEEWQRALDDLDRYEATATDVNLRLWLYRWLATRRAEGRDEANALLRRGVDALPGDALRDVAAIILANSSGEVESCLKRYVKDEEKLCQACFYLGSWRAAETDVAMAVTLLDRAVETGATDLDEYYSAMAARRHLD